MEPGIHMRTHTCSVTEVGVLARRILCPKRPGRIVAVFDRSLYAVFGDDWICIGSKTIGSGPLHVLCERFVPGWFSQGQDVAVADATLVAGAVRLDGLDAAPIWTPLPPPHWTHETLRAGIHAVDDVWRIDPMEEGLAASGCAQFPLAPTHLLTAAMPGVAALCRSIEAELRGRRPVRTDATDIVALIGLGLGLTPSGDDFLAGALLALASLGLSDARDALWNILRAHLDRTNDISAAHLRSAASGYAASALHEAIDAILCGHIDRIAPALAAVSTIGHSSGRDAFAGVLVVLRAVEACASRGGGTLQRPAVAA